MNDFHNRLTRLRAGLVHQELDAYVLATGDEHLSEFIAPFSPTAGLADRLHRHGRIGCRARRQGGVLR